MRRITVYDSLIARYGCLPFAAAVKRYTLLTTKNSLLPSPVQFEWR